VVPVLLGDNARAMAVAEWLQAEGFDVRAIRPPTVPRGTARLRISVNAGVTDEIVERFVRALAAALADPHASPVGSEDGADRARPIAG
jgi:8-amino-7-oxononanoate synthase